MMKKPRKNFNCIWKCLISRGHNRHMMSFFKIIKEESRKEWMSLASSSTFQSNPMRIIHHADPRHLCKAIAALLPFHKLFYLYPKKTENIYTLFPERPLNTWPICVLNEPTHEQTLKNHNPAKQLEGTTKLKKQNAWLLLGQN